MIQRRGQQPAGPSRPQMYLRNWRSVYSCIYCRTQLADHDELVSRSFQGNHGRAYLFNAVINVACGPAVQRQLNTGSHAVADIFCANCSTTLGWKYERAYVDAQKYKEGKFIIELAHVVRENRQLELDRGRRLLLQAASSLSPPSPAGPWSSSSSSSSPPSPAPGSPAAHWAPAAPARAHQRQRHDSEPLPAPKQPREELDDELMFPFYDDLASSLTAAKPASAGYHSRLRRSLYLDSSPYDWKHQAAATSCSPPGQEAGQRRPDQRREQAPQRPPAVAAAAPSGAAAPTIGVARAASLSQSASTLSLDEEQFFDCCSEPQPAR